MIYLGRLVAMVCMMVLVSFLPARAGEEKIIEVSADGSVVVGDDTTMGQAKAAALNNARRSALEKATGVEVRGSSVVYNNILINDMVLAATKGLIVREKVLENKCSSKDELISCFARIEASVKPLKTERRGDFSVTQLSVHRPDRQDNVKSAVFQSLDEVHIHAASNQDAFLHMFSVDQNGNVSKLYPNEYLGYEKTPAGKEVVFPDDNQRKSGLRMKVRTGKGAKKSVESVLVVATRENVQFLRDANIENPTITDLMKELSEIDPSLWAERTEGYEVRE